MRFRHLPAVLSLATLPFLISAATPGAAPPSKSTPGQGAVQQARKAVASVAERYRTLRGYQLEGYSESRFSSSQGQQTSASSVRFKVARPGKLSSEMRNNEMTSRVVSDGLSRPAPGSRLRRRKTPWSPGGSARLAPRSRRAPGP